MVELWLVRLACTLSRRLLLGFEHIVLKEKKRRRKKENIALKTDHIMMPDK